MRKMFYVTKDKETGSRKKMTREEFVGEIAKNKMPVTLEMLKKGNKTGFVKWIIIFSFLIFFIIGIATAVFEVSSDMFNLYNIAFIIIPAIGFIVLKKWEKKNERENESIDAGQFKMVEDEVYDKYYHVSTDSDGDRNYRYYLLTKIYGKLSESSIEYDIAGKGSRVYLLFYNGNEQQSNFISFVEEENRNAKNVDQTYVSELYEISPELQPFVIPYDESLGEQNFTMRIKGQIDELNEKGEKIICKNCGKKYKTKKYDNCPDCGTVNSFELKNVIHCSEWYS